MSIGKGLLGIFGHDSEQNALNTMYESMKPDVTQMQGLIDDYREAGKAIPQSLMDSFNEAIEVGAAAGDESASLQNYANQIWQNGSDELKASLTDPSNPMYETIRSQLPPELTEAIDRAAAETTTDDVTLEGLKASVDGDVDIDKDAWTSKLNEALGDLGETQEVTADHVKIKVDQGDCLWEIGNALGIDWQTIAEQNGIESPYIIHPDQELTISMDTLTAEVDGDKAQAAIEQAMSALDAEGAEMSVTAEGVKVDLADVEVDSDTAAAQIEAALGMESGTLAANGIEVQAGASVTIPSELVELNIVDRRWQSALALALTLPDICGGIAFPEIVKHYRDGRVMLDRQKNPTRDVGTQYIRWFDEYAGDYFKLSQSDEKPYICGERCWQLRCEYLHQNKGFLNDENNIRFHLGLNCGMSVCQLESMNIQENGNDIRIDIEQFCLRMCKAAKSYYDKVHLEKDFSLYNTPVLDFIQVTQKKKAASIIALVCGSERYAKGLKETLQFISDQIMLFYTPESAKTRLGRHKPDLWIVTEDMTSQPNQPWRADRTTPVILITGNPDAVEIKKNSGKLTVLSMPLSIVDLRKTVEIYVS